MAGTLIVAALLLTGCTVPKPVVTFYGNRTAIEVSPELFCDVNTTTLTVDCPAPTDLSNDGHLEMAPEQYLQINVPTEIGDTPWVVVFEYKDAAGKAQNGRTEVFTDGQLAYTLPALGKGTQLTRVEVQSGLVPTLDTSGSTSITASRTWVLVITPAPASSAVVTSPPAP
ncbi:hypothetical protein ABIB25_001283 [Nakamurella sp. UYEF19]|uniref:DUF2771 family protein n=1 Tax=Nakamurella sp. UYEF19 TaxID=1756392 RepID=UPI003394FFFD